MTALRFSEAARADIRAIYRQSIEAFGVAQADAYAAGLRGSIKRLAEFPEIRPASEQFDATRSNTSLSVAHRHLRCRSRRRSHPARPPRP